MLSAIEAAELVKNSDKAKYQDRLDQVLAAIERNARNGVNHMTIIENKYKEQLTAKLQSLGYVVAELSLTQLNIAW